MYVGYTDDLKRRLKEHNNGKSAYSKRYRPWLLLYQEDFDNQIDAIKREKYLKSAAGRRWMKKILFTTKIR